MMIEKNNLKKLTLSNDALNDLKEYKYDAPYQFDSIWEKVEGHVTRKNTAFIFRMTLRIKAVGLSFTAALIAIIGIFSYGRFTEMNRMKQLDKGEAYLVTLTSGDVYLQKKNSIAWNKLQIKDLIVPGDSLRTGSNGNCDIQLINKALSRLNPQTRVTMERLINPDGRMNVDIGLDYGGILLKPNHLSQDEAFSIHTKTALIHVVGTKFSVNADSNGNTKVAVSEGVVKIKPILPKIDKAIVEGKIDQHNDKKVYEALTAVTEVKAGESSEVIESNITALESQIDDHNKLTLTSIESNPALKVGPISEADNQMLSTISSNMLFHETKEVGSIKIDSQPEGAEVYINQEIAGITPLQFTGFKGKHLMVKIVKADFQVFETDLPINSARSLRIDLKKTPETENRELNSSSTSGSKELPGKTVWIKDYSFPELDKEAVYAGHRIILSFGSQLKLFTTEGTALSNITVGDESAVLTRPVVFNNIIYLGSDMGGLFAYTLDGVLSWSNSQAGQTWFNAAPAIYGGMIAVPTIDKGVQIFNTNGKLDYTIPMNKSESVYSTPLFINQGSVIVFGNENGNLSAYDLEAKKYLWNKAILPDRLVYPLVGNDKAVITVCRNNGCVYAVDPLKGKILWKKNFPDLVKMSINPILGDNMLILVGNTPHDGAILITIDLQNPDKVRTTTFENKVSCAVLNQGTLYLGGNSGMVTAYDLQKEERIWTFKTGKRVLVMASDSESVYPFTSTGIYKIAR